MLRKLNLPLPFASLLLLSALQLCTSCKESKPKYQLPVEACEISKEYCPGEEILQWEQVPEKIRAETRMVLLKHMDEEEIDSELEFVKYRINEHCEALDRRGYVFNPFEVQFIRHINNGVFTSLCFRLVFTADQSYRASGGLPSLKDDPGNGNFLSKPTLDSILMANNFSNYNEVNLDYNGWEYELRIYKLLDPEKPRNAFNNQARATVNLHTGEFNSREEWNKATARDFNLLPKFGGIEKTAEQLEMDRIFIDSLLQKEGSPRAASAELVNLAAKAYYSHKPKEAMHLFNQAYLLDSTNAEVYWGFGLLAYKNIEYRSNEWYDIGLALDSNNVRLLRSYGHYEKGKFHSLEESEKNRLDQLKWQDKKAQEKNKQVYSEKQLQRKKQVEEDRIAKYNQAREEQFELALSYFMKALALSPGHLQIMSDLADLYLEKVDCENAVAYYEKSKSLKNNCSAQCFERQLTKKCGDIL